MERLISARLEWVIQDSQAVHSRSICIIRLQDADAAGQFEVELTQLIDRFNATAESQKGE